MYFPYFVSYIFIGLIVGLIFFFWAVKNGQFQDQQRAGFLPLIETTDTAPMGTSRFGTIEVIVLALLACAGLAASGAVVIYALIY
jgi:cbb3-type cytochrome oxidase maturation protein